MAAEYVELTKEDFEEIFKKLNLTVEEYDNPRSREFQFKIQTPHPLVSVMLYSSLEKSTGISRGVGEDAIRLVFWNNKGNHPIGKGKRIYRVTSRDSVAYRIGKTILNFFEDSNNVNIIDWDYVKAILMEMSKNGYSTSFATSLLESLDRYGKLTDGQLAYVLGEKTPKDRLTMEAQLKAKGWVYDPTFAEDIAPESSRIHLPGATFSPSPGPSPSPSPEPSPSREPGEDEEEGEDQRREAAEENNGVPESVAEPGGEGYKQKQVVKYPGISVISDYPGMNLVPTEGYPYKFPTFNPVQSLTYPFKTEDCNLVIGASTSSGKTICAELLMEETLKLGKRVIYLSPLKSLTQEKYDDWKIRFSRYAITILTGDYTLSEEKKAELGRSHIIVMTSEMTDSRTRRMESENNYWLKEVGLVIVDESHILSTSRGHAVESGIMRFTKINPKARIVFLSATMPNVDQLGAWLKSLNYKETKVIYSIWRPVDLQFHYREYPIVRNRFGGESYQASQEAKKSIAIEIVKSKPNEKFLIFTHDKNTGHGLVRRFQEEGIESQFHNADLDLTERLDVEALFTKREGGLRVLISTSTLAWGRNLPARNVIIVGVHRGLNEVDELDIIQMAGRAGRYGIDDEGHVYLIIPEMTTDAWKETFRNPRPVMSVLRSHQILAFHVLAEIQNRVVTDARTLLAWYSRSLAYFQGEEFSLEDAKGLLDDLEKMEMVINKGTYYALTGLGKVSGWLYYSPYDVYGWYRNFNHLFGTPRFENCPNCRLPFDNPDVFHSCRHCGWEYTKPPVDDLTLSWALTDIPSNDWGYLPRDIQSESDEMKWKLRNRGIQASDAIHFGVAAHKLLNGEELEGILKAHARAIKYDIQRIVQALGLIDSQYGKWEKKEFWKVLPVRINYGIPEEMIELVRLPGIGGVKARKMWDKGIRTLSDVANNTEVMKGIFVPVMVKKLQFEAKRLMAKDAQGSLKTN